MSSLHLSKASAGKEAAHAVEEFAIIPLVKGSDLATAFLTKSLHNLLRRKSLSSFYFIYRFLIFLVDFLLESGHFRTRNNPDFPFGLKFLKSVIHIKSHSVLFVF